jgi:peptidyl-tRNA hydrolase
LASGLQMAQALHAAFEFAKEFPSLTKEWMETSNYLVVLQIENENRLQELLQSAKEKGIRCVSFREPDIEDQLTAICLEPNDISRKLCQPLKLALI